MALRGPKHVSFKKTYYWGHITHSVFVGVIYVM